ncbi:MAG: hypothetical protein AMJ93_08535 [Anaerolineae bacterium SM23_84]|nr:MAG: hypothetical protein AMJ93_08535 [Anaerolineae bacterium SM23_84]
MVTGVALDHAYVVELSGRRPVAAVYVVTVVTLASKMVWVERIGPEIVAATALGRGVGVLTILVASGTFGLGMSTREGVKVMIHVLTQERDGNSSE